MASGLTVVAWVSLALGASPAAAAKLKVLDAATTESSPLRFKVKLIGNTERPVRVSYGTVSGTAVAGSDFSTSIGQVAFQPGTTKRMIVVRIVPDKVPEGKETLAVKLWKPIGASLARARATGTIKDDDGPAPAVGGAADAIELRPPAPPKIVIDELMPDPKGLESEYEYVELLNVDTSPVDLGGWTIDAGSECALTGVLAPGGLYVVSDDVLIADGKCPPSLADTGEAVTVRDGPTGSGSVVDAVDYAGFAISSGESLSLDPAKADPAQNDLASSWCTATLAGASVYGPGENIGSPGALNGPCQN